MIKKKGISSECFWKFIRNIKPKTEESAILIKFWDVVEDVEEISHEFDQDSLLIV